MSNLEKLYRILKKIGIYDNFIELLEVGVSFEN